MLNQDKSMEIQSEEENYGLKVILVNGSSHSHGTTMAALEEMIKIFAEANVETEVIQLGGKPIAVARRGGTTASLDALNKYFGIAQMPVAGSTYWNNVHGLFADEAPKDEEGMQTMRNLARNMIWMMRCFENGKQNGIAYPDTETTYCTNFIQRDDSLR